MFTKAFKSLTWKKVLVASAIVLAIAIPVVLLAPVIISKLKK